jgi:hypothetical protein
VVAEDGTIENRTEGNHRGHAVRAAVESEGDRYRGWNKDSRKSLTSKDFYLRLRPAKMPKSINPAQNISAQPMNIPTT